jgi:aromatic-L-amino-acid decarboxylase
MGILVSGGSMGSLTCMAAARQGALARAGSDVRRAGLAGAPRLVLYVSDQGHSCLRKAAELLGLGAANVHVVATDAGYRMELGALRAAIAADRAQGLAPFCVGASAGTVNTGAIDPLSEIADLCAEQGLWFHVDGAIGAVAAVDPTLPALAALSRADSLALDPHKWLSVPAECGAALVRDGRSCATRSVSYRSTCAPNPARGLAGCRGTRSTAFNRRAGFVH